MHAKFLQESLKGADTLPQMDNIRMGIKGTECGRIQVAQDKKQCGFL
jgi:hypothetical protein